jgi:hypothetical protein
LYAVNWRRALESTDMTLFTRKTNTAFPIFYSAANHGRYEVSNPADTTSWTAIFYSYDQDSSRITRTEMGAFASQEDACAACSKHEAMAKKAGLKSKKKPAPAVAAIGMATKSTRRISRAKVELSTDAL